MTQQKAGYPLNYSKGSPDASKDRLREMAEVATDKVKNVTQSAEEIAGKVADQARPRVRRKGPRGGQELQALCRKIHERPADGYPWSSGGNRVRSRRSLEEVRLD